MLLVSLAGSATFLFVFDLLLGVSLRVPDARSWAALIGLGLGTQLVGYVALTYVLGHLAATVTSVGLLAQAPLTALLAAFLLHEPLSGSQVAGGSFVLVGVWTAGRHSYP